MTQVPPAENESLAEMLTPARSTLLVIDVQADFVASEGAMARMGADVSRVPAALARIEALVAAARAARASLAFARVLTRPDTDPEALKRLNARKGGGPDGLAIGREGSPGAEFVRVRPRPGEIEVGKRLYDAFHGTDLEGELRGRGVDTLVCVGFSTHCCVDATARAAFHRDFNVFVVADATDAYDAELQRATLRSLAESCALIVDAAAVLDAWGATKGPA